MGTAKRERQKANKAKREQEIRGEADALATGIYASAYDQSPQAREFYVFVKTMDTYRKILGPDTALVFSSGSDLFRFLGEAGGDQPGPAAAPEATNGPTMSAGVTEAIASAPAKQRAPAATPAACPVIRHVPMIRASSTGPRRSLPVPG